MGNTLEKYIENTGNTWYKPETEKEIKIYKEYAAKGLLVSEDGYFTLPLVKQEEEIIAVHMVIKEATPCKKYPTSIIDIYIKRFEEMEHITLDTWQKEAVYQAINNYIFILTGGPGTGKTCVIKCIYYCLQKILQTEKILLSAPTGKAARRITESTGYDAQTVAKAIGLTHENAKPKNLSSKVDVMIVDEISMLDTKTCKALVEAIIDCRLILVGDVEQLPSVGYGSVLRDLIDAGLPCTKLEKTFRQTNESGLFANIEQIKKGLHLGFVERNDFRVLHTDDEKSTMTTMVNEYLDAVKKYGLEQVVCLTPFRRKGKVSAIRLNRILQNEINSGKSKKYVSYQSIESDGFTYEVELRVGDPVMQLENTELVANGDVGIVSDIDLEKKLVFVKFGDEIVRYYPNELGQLALAYAMSVHKAQGSEYACVITSALAENMSVLSRNTIYTAITRAKKECIVVSQKGIAEKACERESGYERITRLTQSIQRNRLKLELRTHLATI